MTSIDRYVVSEFSAAVKAADLKPTVDRIHTERTTSTWAVRAMSGLVQKSIVKITLDHSREWRDGQITVTLKIGNGKSGTFPLGPDDTRLEGAREVWQRSLSALGEGGQ